MGGATTQTKKSKRPRLDQACSNSDDANWDRRHQHRCAGLNSVYRSKDAISMYVLIAIGELSPEEAPIPPDPYDRNISKRQWELGTRSQKYINYRGSKSVAEVRHNVIFFHRRYADVAQCRERLHPRSPMSRDVVQLGSIMSERGSIKHVLGLLLIPRVDTSLV